MVTLLGILAVIFAGWATILQIRIKEMEEHYKYQSNCIRDLLNRSAEPHKVTPQYYDTLIQAIAHERNLRVRADRELRNQLRAEIQGGAAYPSKNIDGAVKSLLPHSRSIDIS